MNEFTTTVATTPAVVDADGVSRVTDAVHLDCPVLNKVRAVTVPEGGYSVIEWQIRDSSGQPVDLTSRVNQVLFRFMDGAGADMRVVQVVGTLHDATTGLVHCELPDDLVANAGTFVMNIGVSDSQARLWVQDRGYLSVERGLFGDVTTADNLLGPPTLGELRLVLRDTLIENNLLDDVEFDDSELFYMIVRPVQEWNEAPPPVALYSTRNFPFREAWTNAIVGKLLRTAAIWYERNRLAASHGGVNVDDKNKLNPYLLLAQQFDGEWKQFITAKKIEINICLAYGSVSSPYG